MPNSQLAIECIRRSATLNEYHLAENSLKYISQKRFCKNILMTNQFVN